MLHGAFSKQIPNLASAMLLFYGLATPALYLSHAENAHQASVLFLLALWAVSPALGSIWLVNHSSRGTIAGYIVLVSFLLIFGQGVYVYAQSFFLHPNPQSGIAAVFMPLVQWLGVLVLHLVIGRLENHLRQDGRS